MKTIYFLWGRHPLYTNGLWIKLSRAVNPNQYKKEMINRINQGFEVCTRKKGEMP
jgi:hypothetical protein